MTEHESNYLLSNHKTESVPAMAKALKRANVTVYGWMAELGLKGRERVIGRDHPFRCQNRKLEAMLLKNRIENSRKKRSQIKNC